MLLYQLALKFVASWLYKTRQTRKMIMKILVVLIIILQTNCILKLDFFFSFSKDPVFLCTFPDHMLCCVSCFKLTEIWCFCPVPFVYFVEHLRKCVVISIRWSGPRTSPKEKREIQARTNRTDGWATAK